MFRLIVSGDGFADLAGFEPGVAEIEIKRRGGVARMNYFFISRGRLGKFVLIIEFVRGLEQVARAFGAVNGNAAAKEEGQESANNRSAAFRLQKRAIQ